MEISLISQSYRKNYVPYCIKLLFYMCYREIVVSGCRHGQWTLYRCNMVTTLDGETF